jgi:hypothetical protein
MRVGERSRGGVEIWRRGTLWRRNRRWRPSGSADFGEKSRQPGGVSCRGNEREMGEKVTATYRRGRWEETAGIKREINRGGELLWGNGRRRDQREEGEPDRVGPPVSVQERGKIPIRVFPSWAAGWFHFWAERVPWGPVLYFYFLFSFSFFCFLTSFITFANLIQIASNHLCEVSKIPSNIPEQ